MSHLEEYDTESHPLFQPLEVGPITYSEFFFETLLPIRISTTGTGAHQNALQSRIIVGRCFSSVKASFQCEKCISIHTISFGLRIHTNKDSGKV